MEKNAVNEHGRFNIVFHYTDGTEERYKGGQYRFQGEYYAQLADHKDEAKIFKTRTAAVNKAEWLKTRCSNTGIEYSIEDIDKPVDIYTGKARALGHRLTAKEKEPTPTVCVLTVCPHCKADKGFYIKRIEKSYYKFNGEYKYSNDESGTGNDGLYCSACDGFIMTKNEFQSKYGIVLKY